MSLTLYYHPLSSFCHKVLIALYENGVRFSPVIVDFGNAKSAAAFKAVWPMAKMPVLRDEGQNQIVAESTVVIEYLDTFQPGRTRFVPEDPRHAWQVRMWDRLYDNYVQVPMQKIVSDHLRPEDQRDPWGVDQAIAQLEQAYDYIDRMMETVTWAAGNEVSLADCSAAPALFFADTVSPFGPKRINLTRYFDRLIQWPAYKRVLQEAEPYFQNFPLETKPSIGKAAKGGGG